MDDQSAGGVGVSLKGKSCYYTSSPQNTALVCINHGASHKHPRCDVNTKSAIDKWIVSVDDSVQVRASRLLHFMNISLRLSPYQSEIFAGLILLKASASHLIGVDGYGAVAKKTP